jgi:hypothetical protein
MIQDDPVRTSLDGAAVITAAGALFQWLPAVASLFTIIWLGIRIYESDTVQNLLYGKKEPEE